MISGHDEESQFAVCSFEQVSGKIKTRAEESEVDET